MTYIYQKIRTRTLIVQALYQYLSVEISKPQLVADFRNKIKRDDVDEAYFNEVLDGVIVHKKKLDQQLQLLVDRPYGQIEIVVLAVLYLGAYELIYKMDVSYLVVLNQSIEIAKKFASKDGYKYVNAILDKLAFKTRLAETQQK